MFDFVHEKKRVVQVVLAIIILPFALWGVDSYRNAGGPAPLATVNGEKIGQQEFEEAMEQQRQRIREMAGNNFDPAFFDQPEIKRSVLEGLVTQRVLSLDAKQAGLMPSEEQIAQILINIGAFQKDGKFDRATYEAALKARGMNWQVFENRLRQDIATRLLTDGYAQHGYAATTVAGALARLNEQQRVVALATLTPEAFSKQVRVSDADIAGYYEQHADDFRLAERVNLEYVMFSADSLLPSIKLTDAEVKQYYEEHAAEFGTQEQRQAAHILIATSKQASEEEKKAAHAKAEEVLKQVRQAPTKFAALAKQYSQDPGSSANGGDLGMFGRGAMVKPFEDSVFSLKTGEISGLVQSDFGYHIIKLVAIKPAKVPALSEVRGMIEQRLKTQAAADKFAELAEQFNNTVYEQSDTLKPAAELVKAPIQRSGWLTKGQAASGIWSDKVLQAVFSEDVLKNKRNSAAIEAAPNTLLAARMVEYNPARVRPLAEVSATIRQTLLRERAAELAQQEGAKTLAALQHGDKAALSWKAAQAVSRNQRSQVAPELLQAIFRADTGKLPAYVGVAAQDGSYLLARIDAVKEAAPADAAKLAGYAQQLRRLTGEELLMAYLADAKKRADISMKQFAADAGK
jgi:peptidyl-prolyl cis-trans isomerase D